MNNKCVDKYSSYTIFHGVVYATKKVLYYYLCSADVVKAVIKDYLLKSDSLKVTH